jgi:hypothetical protein
MDNSQAKQILTNNQELLRKLLGGMRGLNQKAIKAREEITNQIEALDIAIKVL